MTILISIISTIITLVVVFYLIITLSSSKMRHSATDFLNSVKKGNFAKAYELMAPASCNSIAKQDFEEFLATLGVYDIVEIRRSLGDYSIGTALGTISPFLVRADNICLQVHMDMRKEDELWRVASISVIKGIDLDEIE